MVGALLIGLVTVALLAGRAGATFPGRNGFLIGQGPPADLSHATLVLVGKAVKVVGIGNHPSWSPDGKRLVVGDDRGIEIAALKGMRLASYRSLVRQAASAAKTGIRWVGIPSWSGDGRYVVYVRQETPRRGSDIYTVRIADGRTFRLTHAPPGWRNTDPAWSPDNTTIAFVHCNPSGSRCALERMDRHGSHQRVLLSQAGVEVTDPKWSPDGRKLGMTVCKGFACHSAILDPASHRLRSTRGEAFATWTPDGRYIVVRIGRDTTSGCSEGLTVMTESGNSARNLPCGPVTGDWQPLH